MAYLYDPAEPVVQTKYGKLRGYTFGDVNHFLGVRYAKAKRFHMPEEPDCWEGIQEAKTFGATMLQMNPYRPVARNMGLNIPWAESEDCYFLNIWAPKHDDGIKRPVFVYMHGGGFFAGSSIMEVENMEGFNMANKADVVFVSMNHRLNVLGHLNLADYGEEFENSKNLGIADLVAALKWIHENIEAFGGDPGNVTISGHSGGGGKVLSMYQIEEAKDYFTRGIVMSGVLDDGPETTEEESRLLAKTMMDHLGITKENIDKVYEVPFRDLVDAYRAAQKVLNPQGVNTGLAPLKNDYFRGFPISDGFCEWSKDKDLMLGTTLSEFNFKVHIPVDKKVAMTEDEKLAMIADRFGERYGVLLDLFKKAYPDHDILDLMYLDAGFRRPSCETAKIHSQVSAFDNTYIYLFAFNMPSEGRMPAWHGADIPFAFWNSEKAPIDNEPVYGKQNADAIGNAYLNFIRCGNPNNEYLPEWKTYTAEHRYTMVIDKKNELKEAYDEELIKLYIELCPPLNWSPLN